ncbi:MAG: hypothetical protein ACJ8LM_04225 [Candidatus Udaeobacter sp.]
MSGLPPKHGLLVSVFSGPYPPHGKRARSTAAGENPAAAAPDNRADSEPFTRTETISVRLPDRKLHPFSVYALLDTAGALLIEFVEISIYEDDEKLCDIPISSSSVLLEKPGDSHIFRPTDRQFATISEHLEEGKAVKVVAHYLATEQSELNIGILGWHCHHKLGYVLLLVGLGCAVPALTKHFPVRQRAPTT